MIEINPDILPLYPDTSWGILTVKNFQETPKGREAFSSFMAEERSRNVITAPTI